MNIKELKKIGIKRCLENDVEEAVIKINIVLQHILKMTKTELIINEEKEISKEEEENFFKEITEIINGKPIQYITNNQEFMGLSFWVDENVLIPQPDTEILVESTLNKIKEYVKNRTCSNKKSDTIKILDLCTGSGAIAVAIENYINKIDEIKIMIYATDISKKALEIAKKNALFNNPKSNINFILSNMFEKIIEKDFDIIVSNPPYIETETILKLSKEVQSEPHIALDGGKDGLKYYRIIAKEAKKYLNPKGYLLLEIGYNQKEKVIEIFERENYSSIKCQKDLNGNDRIIEMKLDDVM